MKILDVRWFSGTSCVGVVRVEDPYEGIKYYISTATGMDEKIDMEHIAAWGATFPNEVGDMLFGVRKDELYDLQNGNTVVIPKSKQHAEAMVKVGMFYLENHK